MDSARIANTLLFAWYYFVVRRLPGGCFSRFIGSMVAPVIFVVPMAGVVISIAPLLSKLPGAMQLATQVIVGGVIYAGLYLSFRKNS